MQKMVQQPAQKKKKLNLSLKPTLSGENKPKQTDKHQHHAHPPTSKTSDEKRHKDLELFNCLVKALLKTQQRIADSVVDRFTLQRMQIDASCIRQIALGIFGDRYYCCHPEKFNIIESILNDKKYENLIKICLYLGNDECPLDFSPEDKKMTIEIDQLLWKAKSKTLVSGPKVNQDLSKQSEDSSKEGDGSTSDSKTEHIIQRVEYTEEDEIVDVGEDYANNGKKLLVLMQDEVDKLLKNAEKYQNESCKTPHHTCKRCQEIDNIQNSLGILRKRIEVTIQNFEVYFADADNFTECLRVILLIVRDLYKELNDVTCFHTGEIFSVLSYIENRIINDLSSLSGKCI